MPEHDPDHDYKITNCAFAPLYPKGLNEWRDHVHRIALEHGFTEATFGEDIALIHSELSEALEDFRHGKRPAEEAYVDRKPVGIPSELADAIIRILHLCGKHGIDIEKAVTEKSAYNETRPYRHGKVL